jgi:uncharacterized Zn finger protein
MPRENAEAKGRRYLVEGRVYVQQVNGHHVLARVRGSGEMHTVTGDAWGWRCTCPARGTCSHLVAVQLIAVKPRRTP